MHRLVSLSIGLIAASDVAEYYTTTLDNYLQFIFHVDRWQNHQLIALADRADQLFHAEDSDNCPVSCSQIWFIAPRRYRNDFLYDQHTNYFRCCPGNALLALARGQICGGLPWAEWHAQQCCLVLPETARNHFQQSPFSANVLPFLDSWSCQSRWTPDFQLYWDRGVVSGQYETFLTASNSRASEIDVNHRLMSLDVASSLRAEYSERVLF